MGSDDLGVVVFIELFFIDGSISFSKDGEYSSLLLVKSLPVALLRSFSDQLPIFPLYARSFPGLWPALASVCV